VLDDLSGQFDLVFQQVCKDSRAVYETHAVSRVGKANVSGELMLQYCDNVAQVLESFGGVSIRPAGAVEIFEESVNKSSVSPLVDYDSTSSTSSVRSTSSRGGKSAQLHNGHCCYEFIVAPESDTQATACLLSAVLFSTVLPTLSDRLEVVLQNNEMSTQISAVIQDQCVSRLEHSCLVQLEANIIYRCHVTLLRLFALH